MLCSLCGRYPYDEAVEIGRDQWAFDRLEDGRAAIRFSQGFEPGRIYNLVYTGKNPTVMGTGFAATRDFVSFLKVRNRWQSTGQCD